MARLRTNHTNYETPLPFPWNESPRGITITVLGEEYSIEYDEEENVPKDNSELELLKLQLEIKIANGELENFVQRYYPEEGYTVFPGLNKLIRITTDHLSQNENESLSKRRNSLAAQEADRYCLYQLKKNSSKKGSSDGRNSKVLTKVN